MQLLAIHESPIQEVMYFMKELQLLAIHDINFNQENMGGNSGENQAWVVSSEESVAFTTSTDPNIDTQDHDINKQ